jgi:hypothetical protein
MKRIFDKPRGQMMVFYSGIIAVLLGAIALSSDVGVMYFNWQQIRTAADASAIAGALQFLPTAPAVPPAAGCPSSPTTNSAACTYAVNNSAKVSETTITVPAPNPPASVPAAFRSQTIQVTINRTDIPVLFGRALGMTTPYQASVTAVAVGPLPLSGARNPFPAGLPASSGAGLKYGQQIQLVNADPSNKNGSYGPGNWGWLDLAGTGASNIANNITSGCGCQINVNDFVGPATGEEWGQVSKAVDSLITNPGLAPANLTGNESQLVTVPIVTPFSNGNTQVQVLGFAEMWLVSNITKASNGQTLTVEFVKYVPNDGVAGGASNDFGAYSKPVLVE